MSGSPSSFGPDVADAIDTFEVGELLAALADKSLVVLDQSTGRFRLLETVRDYARVMLAAAGEAEMFRDRHLDYFLALAEQARTHLRGGEMKLWLERLETEHDNLRSALDWSRKEDGGEPGLRLAGSLWRFWLLRGHWSEGIERLEVALEHAEAQSQSEARGRALNAAGAILTSMGRSQDARILLDQALVIQREIGDRWGQAGTLMNLGILAMNKGSFDESRTLQERALALYTELDDKPGIAGSKHNLAQILFKQGDYSTARTLWEQSMEIDRATGGREQEAHALLSLASIARSAGELDRALEYTERSLVIRRELGDVGGEAYALNSFGLIAIDRGDLAAARSHFEQALTKFRKLGNREWESYSLGNLANIAMQEREYRNAQSLFQRGLNMAMQAGIYEAAVEFLGALATLNARQGKPYLASSLWGAAERLREEIGSHLPSFEAGEYEQDLAAARDALADDAAFNSAWAEGRVMTLEQAIVIALDKKKS